MRAFAISEHISRLSLKVASKGMYRRLRASGRRVRIRALRVRDRGRRSQVVLQVKQSRKAACDVTRGGMHMHNCDAWSEKRFVTPGFAKSSCQQAFMWHSNIIQPHKSQTQRTETAAIYCRYQCACPCNMNRPAVY
jgi:hypothetical protein